MFDVLITNQNYVTIRMAKCRRFLLNKPDCVSKKDWTIEVVFLNSLLFFQDKPVKENEKTATSTRGDQNIFAALAGGFLSDSKPESAKTELNESVKTDISDKNKQTIEKMESESSLESEKAVKKEDNSVTEDKCKVVNTMEKTESSDEKKTVVLKRVDSDAENVFVDVEGVSDLNNETKLDKSDTEVVKSKDSTSEKKDSVSSETGESKKKRHDSVDSKKSHHHHHRKHSHEHRDRRDSAVDKDGSSHSHRRDSHEHRDSKDRRESSDSRRHSKDSDRERHRSSSHSKSSKDKDRSERRSSESKDKDRRDSVKDTTKDKKKDEKGVSIKDGKDSGGDKSMKVPVGQVVKKVVKPGAKVKPKKLKKNEDIAVDSSMIDLFKPDNLPTPAKEETPIKQEEAVIKEEKVKETRVKFSLDIEDDDQKRDRKQLVEDKVEIINLNKEIPDLKADENKNSSSELKMEELELNNDIKEKVTTSEELSGTKSKKVSRTETENESQNKDTAEAMEVEEGVPDTDNEKLKEFVNVDSEKAETNLKTENVTAIDKSVEKDLGQEVNSSEKVAEDSIEKAKGEESKLDENVTEEKVKQVDPPKPEKKTSKPLRMSDFFSERRLKINDPKPKKTKVVPVEPSVEDSPQGRSKRNKAKALSEILKKEKLGSGK